MSAPDSDAKNSIELHQTAMSHSHSSTNTTSKILTMFHAGMNKIRITTVLSAINHICVASVLIWIVSVKYSPSVTFCAILAMVTVCSVIITVIWVFMGTTNGVDADPDYTWLTKGFMWSVVNLFLGNLGHIMGFVLFVSHTKKAHFLDLMFNQDKLVKKSDFWPEKYPGLFAGLLIHGHISLIALITDAVLIVIISKTLLQNPKDNGQKPDEKKAQNEAEDDEDDLGPVRPLDKKLAIWSIICEVILQIDFIMVASVANKIHSGLFVLNVIVLVSVVYRIYTVRKCYLVPKNLNEESLVNHRIFCIVHMVAVWFLIWIAILLSVVLVHFNETGLINFVFKLPQPGQQQSIALVCLLVLGLMIYTYLLYTYQKCMWLADKIASEKLADMLISAEEDDEGDGEADNQEGNDAKQQP